MRRERNFSLKLRVSARSVQACPPVFLWQTNEDKVVSVEHSLLYAAALREHGIPHELHLYQHGKHGTGLIGTEHPWFGDLLFWLRAHGFVAGKTEANPK